VFLGMNAHITRDLAYVVAEIVRADRSLLADPIDYLLVNEVIADVQRPMLQGAAARFDPALSNLASLVPPDAGLTSVDLITQWRRQSFDLGTRLGMARSVAERDVIAAEIERNAVAVAVLILNADTSLAVDDTHADRDAYCASHQ
jgi:hypothetical protein